MASSLHRTDRGDVVVLEVGGRMAIEAATGNHGLNDAVVRALQEGKRLFVIDGAAVTYADSAALGEFVRAYTRAAAGGGKLVFAVPNAHQLRNRFHLTKLDRELIIFETVDEAIHSLTLPERA